jgi:hypothetical protein
MPKSDDREVKLVSPLDSRGNGGSGTPTGNPSIRPGDPFGYLKQRGKKAPGGSPSDMPRYERGD